MADHDHSYKHLFSHARMVEDLLKGFVREDWVDNLDFSSLEKVNGSYISDDLREREDDIIWRIKWGRDWLYVYILLEFQSTVDQWMAVRIMTYVGLLYQDLIQLGNLYGKDRLPPVLPILLHNGGRQWTAGTEIGKLIQHLPGGLEKYRPRMRYLLLSEREYDDEDQSGINNLVNALFRLENSRNPQHLLEVVTLLLEWLSGPGQDSLRRAFTVWFHQVLFPGRTSGANTPILEELGEVKNMLAERVKEWTKEWEEAGIQKGMQKGARQLLARQMKAKFGTLAPDFITRMEQADEEEILLWSERILTADVTVHRNYNVSFISGL